jgi:segregation and condensation protein B
VSDGTPHTHHLSASIALTKSLAAECEISQSEALTAMSHSIFVPILKALLFSNAEPLSIKTIQDVFNRFSQEVQKLEQEVIDDENLLQRRQQLVALKAEFPQMLTAAYIRDALEVLGAKLEAESEVYRLIEGSGGYRLAIIPEYADWVRWLRGQPRPARLSGSVLETLAIIAYRQPITRAQIEAIRGVAADSAISKLTEFELVYVSARADLPGRPAQYNTTEKFLELVGITHLSELPTSDVVNPRTLGEWIHKQTDAQIHMKLTDTDVGLPP